MSFNLRGNKAVWKKVSVFLKHNKNVNWVYIVLSPYAFFSLNQKAFFVFCLFTYLLTVGFVILPKANPRFQQHIVRTYQLQSLTFVTLYFLSALICYRFI